MVYFCNIQKSHVITNKYKKRIDVELSVKLHPLFTSYFMLKEYEKHRPKNMLFQPIAVVTSALSGFFNFIVKNFESVVVQRLI